MATKSLHDLFLHFLRDILYAEKQGLKAMKLMQRKADSDAVKTLLESHRTETEGQLENLERAFDLLDKSARGVRCEAIDGIIEEAKELVEEARNGPTRDAAIIAAVQAVEHYEITRYGTLVAWARQLDHDDIAELCAANLAQEEGADRKLTALAEKHLNAQAQALAG